MKRLPQVLAVIVFGVVVAVSAFWITSMNPHDILLTISPPLCTNGKQTVTPPYFDPWTGFRHGNTYVCDNGTGSYVVESGSPGGWAFPLPLGFVIGAGVMIVVLRLGGRRRGET